MGCFSGSKERVNIDDDFAGPVKQRSCTDVTFLIIKIIFVIGLFALVGHCMANGDLFRMFHGYDNCGNVCGKKNLQSTEAGFCRGGDFTDKKLLKYDTAQGLALFDVKYTKRECTSNCSGFVQVLNKCFPPDKNATDFVRGERPRGERVRPNNSPSAQALKNITVKPPKKKNSTDNLVKGLGDFFEEIAEDMGNTWHYLVYLALIAFALSLFFLLMFRYAAAVIVWFSLILMIVLSVAWATYLWVLFGKQDTSTPRGQEKATDLCWSAIVMTVVALVVVLLILVMRKRIRLVIQLFEEAARAAAAMPLIFIQPIWTFLSLAIVGFLWFYFAIYIQSAGKLAHVPATDKHPDINYFYYKKDIAMKVARWYNIIAAFWMSQFVISCQHMVLAGAVSTWYFSRDKSHLGSPIFTGFKNLVRYHLGSVLLGSLIMAIIAFIKFLLKLAERAVKKSDNMAMKCAYYCFRCIMNCVERIFNMISRNAYVEIAIYGKGFCPSALRGLKVLFNNMFSAAAINSIGDFVLLIVKLLIVVITLLISTFMLWNKDNIHHPWLPILLCILFTFFIAHTFISVFEMIIDTLFICFCEDCEMNDGITKPYFMNRGLMEFVENSKRYLKLKETNEVEPSAPPMQ